MTNDQPMNYAEWFFKAVKAGMEDVNAGRVIPHDELKKEW